LSAKAQRRTGTLRLTAGGRTWECLSWPDIQYTFDAKAKLPTEETIARPIDEILA
jgi:hypothetical protein